MEYAYDMSHISSDIRNIKYEKKTLQSKLNSWNLIKNEENQKNTRLGEKEKEYGRNLSYWERF